MLHSDAVKGDLESISSVYNNIHNVTVDVVSEIQKDLTSYDLTSLVFLLYDVPDTALQRLKLLQRVSKDVDARDMNMNLLYDWAVHSHLRNTWRYEFLEALAVCQLFGIIKKLGFNVESVKKHYSSKDVHSSDYVNPIKKVLYILCEDMDSDNVMKLKNALLTYNVDVAEYEVSELIILELLSCKFISTGSKNFKNELLVKCSLDKLAAIIENCPGLADMGKILREVENNFNYILKKPNLFHTTPSNSTINENEKVLPENLQDSIGYLTQLMEEKIYFKNIKADATNQHSDAYEIKNTKRVGVCYIINQEIFNPSRESLENKMSQPLDNRNGSTKDKYYLLKTMKQLNFHVETDDNLKHKDILSSIKRVVKNIVRDDDSIFVLCILSHGIEGHVYGADSVPVSVKDIEQLLDSDDATKLRHKPKVFIIQACQSNHDTEPLKLIADGPSKGKNIGKKNYYLPHSDFLILWATAPDFEAYRVGDKGSFFIHCVCDTILKNIDKQHFAEMCTTVTCKVSNFCAEFNCAQIPIYKSTLRKRLFLRSPVTLT